MISAIILAAGESKRMGQPKMLLPWGNRTVIEHVVTTFLNAGVEDIIVVTGGAKARVEAVLANYSVWITHNLEYTSGEMLSSLQQAIRNMPGETQAALIGLGDQPQVQESSIRAICEAYKTSRSTLIVPSFQMKRGHPWLVARPLWNEILELRPPSTPRDLLNKYSNAIHYVTVDTPTILADLDTPEDYRKSHP
jgi:molybdenum cofactor cytidylyltransferase